MQIIDGLHIYLDAMKRADDEIGELVVLDDAFGGIHDPEGEAP